MSYETEKKKAGREPVYMVDLLLDYCDHSYGNLPCRAALGITGEVKCYNTRATCQDPISFAASPKTYRFVQPREGFPAGFQRISSLRSVDFSPTTIDEDGGLGQRAMVTVTFQDHPHHDRGIDKYVGERAYTPEEQGTFWTKLRARNPYYKNRTLRLWEGYLTEPFDLANFRSRDFIIESISPPDASGRVKVVAKDILKLADGDKAVWPPVTTGKLAKGIRPNDTEIELSPGSGVQYAGFSHVAIGDEIIRFGGVDGDTLTACVRGINGATDSYDAGEAVQACAAYENQNVVDIVRELLTGPAKVPSEYIDDAEWNTERDGPLKTFLLSAIIPEPTAVKELLQELLKQCLIAVWQDDVSAKVRLRSLTPWVETVASITDDQLVDGRITIKDLPSQRVSRVRVYHGIRNYAEDVEEAKNYRRAFMAVDGEAESAHKHNEVAEVVHYSRWFTEDDASGPQLLASRLLDRKSEIPQSLAFTLDARHEKFGTGDVIELTTRLLVNEQGMNHPRRVLITRRAPDGGHQYHFTGVVFPDPPPPVVTIEDDAFQVDIYTRLSAPTEPVNVTVNLVGCTVYSGSPKVPALRSGPLPDGSSIRLNVGAFEAEAGVRGCGGPGGGGGYGVAEYQNPPPDRPRPPGDTGWQFHFFPGAVGADGGDAIETEVPIIIDNTFGTIFGGGGGGAGGQGHARRTSSGGSAYGGGGGGGGRSYALVPGGQGGGPHVYAELAQIFEDAAGEIQKDNPFQNDANGRVQFYAPNAIYTVEYAGPHAELIDGVAMSTNVDATVGDATNVASGNTGQTLDGISTPGGAVATQWAAGVVKHVPDVTLRRARRSIQ